MATGRKSDFTLPTFDSIFSTQEQRDDAKLAKIRDIPISEIEYLLQSPVFKLTYDIGHNHSIGGIDEPFILQKKKYLKHMHIHDALGKKNHLAVGSGELDLNKYISLAEEVSCRCVLETKTIAGLKQSVYHLKENGLL